MAVTGRRELVQPVVAAEHQRRRPAGLEDADEQRDLVQRGHADGGCLGPRGVAERAEEVEHRRDAEFGAHRPRMPESRVEQGGVGERDPRRVEHLRDPLRREREVDAERRQHVGRPGCRARRPVAVLDHGRAGRGRNDRGHRRHVHGAEAVAAGADDVERVRVDRQREGVRENGIPESDDLVDGLAFRPQRDQERGELRWRRAAGHDLLHGPGGLGDRQVGSREQLGEHRGPGQERRHGHDRTEVESRFEAEIIATGTPEVKTRAAFSTIMET